ncbi:MAG: formate dehydrogenase subunit gamma [Hyphomicrobium sp.]
MAKKSGKMASSGADGVIPAPTPAEVAALAVCARHGNKASELLEILHELQIQLGYVPEATKPVIAKALNLSRAEVHGVVTFYHDFRSEPAGRHVIKICRAEACQAMGTDHLCSHAEKALGAELGGTSKDGRYTVEAVYCLGNCALSPAILIGERLFGKVDAKRFDAIVAGLDKEAAE